MISNTELPHYREFKLGHCRVLPPSLNPFTLQLARALPAGVCVIVRHTQEIIRRRRRMRDGLIFEQSSLCIVAISLDDLIRARADVESGRLAGGVVNNIRSKRLAVVGQAAQA